MGNGIGRKHFKLRIQQTRFFTNRLQLILQSKRIPVLVVKDTFGKWSEQSGGQANGYNASRNRERNKKRIYKGTVGARSQAEQDLVQVCNRRANIAVTELLRFLQKI